MPHLRIKEVTKPPIILCYQVLVFKLAGPTWAEKFKLPVGSYSVSDIQDYIKYIMKNNKKLIIYHERSSLTVYK